MNSKERVLTTLNHQEPDKIPFDLSGSLVTGIHRIAYDNLRDYLGLEKRETKLFDLVQGLALVEDDMLERLRVDTRGVLTGSSSGWQMKMEEAPGFEQYRDIWDITWRKPIPHGLYYDIVRSPLKGKTLDEAKKYLFPEAKDEKRLLGIKQRASELGNSGSLVMLGCSGMTAGLFQQLQWIMGHEYCFLCMLADPDLIHYLIQRLAETDIGFWDWAIPYLGDDIKVVLYSDDFGLQNAPAISHEMFETFFKPWYSKIFSTIKKHQPDIKIFFHSCGSSRFIIPDLIESGVDIFNPVQTNAADMDPFQLKKDFGKDITFWGGGIDTQKVLPFGTRQAIIDNVKMHIDALAPGGGFVFATIHNIQADVPPENIMTMWEALQKYGNY